MTDREQDLVELVAEDGTAAGSCTVAEAHRPPGRLHRAFSVVLLDADGRCLLQRRAAVKTRFAGRWANTCCGHPAPGRSPVEAAGIRLAEEIGVRGVDLTEAGVWFYRAVDPATGRVECEYDHVLTGSVAADLETSLDPAEVSAVEWRSPQAALADLDASPNAYAPWLQGVLMTALGHSSVAGPGAPRPPETPHTRRPL